jgi:hypothetical protein
MLRIYDKVAGVGEVLRLTLRFFSQEAVGAKLFREDFAN